MSTLFIILPDVEIKSLGGYVYPYIKNAVYTPDKGKPYLPMYVTVVKQPTCAIPTGLWVVEAETLRLFKPLFSSQGFVPADGRLREYDSIKPSYNGEYGGFYIKGWRCDKEGNIYVVISPFKYMHSEKLLIYAKRVRVMLDVGKRSISEGYEGRSSKYDMLVVYPDNFSGFAVKRFVEIKKRFAINVVPVKVSEANSFYGRDKAERIRNLVKFYYRYYGIKWVLLVGDTNVVPVRYAKVYSGFLYGNDIPTDLYYADLDGDWDGNGNGIFGEFADSLDLFADVYVGRIPVNDENLFYEYVKRIEDYLNFRPVYLKFYSLGMDLFRGGANEGMDAINYMFQDAPGTVRMSKDSASNLKSFVDSLRSNFFITVVAHGNFQHFYMGKGYYTIHTADTQNINKPIFLNIIDCNNGAMDKPSLVKFLFNNGNSGVIGVRATSRLNNPSFSAFVDKMFIDYIFSGTSVGEAFYKSLAGFIPLANDNIYGYLLFGYILFGDPSLFIWKDIPGSLNPTVLWPEKTSGTLEILCDSGCRVMIDNYETFVSNGGAITVSGNLPSNLSLYLFKPGKYPYSSSRVLKGPHLVFLVEKRLFRSGDTSNITVKVINGGSSEFYDSIKIYGIYDTSFVAYIGPGMRINLNVDVFSPYPADTFIGINGDTINLVFLENMPRVVVSEYGSWVFNFGNVPTDTFFVNGNPYMLQPGRFIHLPYDTVVFQYGSYLDTLIPSFVDTPSFVVVPSHDGVKIFSSDTFVAFGISDFYGMTPISPGPIGGYFFAGDSYKRIGIGKVSGYRMSRIVMIDVSSFPRMVWERFIRGVGHSSPVYYGGYIYVASDHIFKVNLQGKVVDSVVSYGEVWDEMAAGDGMLGVVSSNGYFSIYDTTLRPIKSYEIPVYPTLTQVAYFNGKFYVGAKNTLLRCDTLICDTIFVDTSNIITSFTIRPSGEIFLTSNRKLYRLLADSIGLIKVFPNNCRQVVSTNNNVFVLMDAYIYSLQSDSIVYSGESDGFMAITSWGKPVISLSNGVYINGNTLGDLWTLAFGNQPLCANLNGNETCLFGSGEGWIYAFDTLGNLQRFSPFEVGVLIGKSYQIFEKDGKIYLIVANSWSLKLYELGNGSTYNHWYAVNGSISRTNHLHTVVYTLSEERKRKDICFKISKEGISLNCYGKIFDVSGRKVFEGKGVFGKTGVYFVKVGGKVFKVIFM